jgi:nitrite reductase/ring-hydroxylating ferredoxin subunit
MPESPDKIILCRLSDLPDPGSLGLRVELSVGGLEVLLVRKDGAVYGYQNYCPHTGVNLDWLPNQFLDVTQSFIQCATHGALFRVEDGYCLRGPCAGDRLQPLTLEVVGGEVLLLTLAQK